MSKSIHVAICDDEKIFCDRILKCMLDVTNKQGIKCTSYICERGTKLIRLCEEKKLDAVFLDIAMPGINGFETAEKLLKIRSSLIIIFVSSQETMVFSAYEYKPFWFVPKSQLSMLELVINKLIKKVELQASEYPIIAVNVENNKMIEIDIREVAYFKTDDHYIRVVSKNGSESRSYRCKLDFIEQQLSQQWFMRVHSRYLINCRMVSLIEKNTCVLINNERIPISRSNMAITKEIFQRFLRSRR